MNGFVESDILRIYICGPHSTGKTTLLNDLKPNLDNVTIVEEVARGIIKNHSWSRDDFRPDKHPDVFRKLNEEILKAQIANDRKYTSLGKEMNGYVENDILRIYICGPHSTGKTTLLNDLKPNLDNVTIVEEVARGIIRNHSWSRDDFRPDKHPDVFRQLNEEILIAQIANDRKYTTLGKDFICDRAIDPIIYCGYYVSEQAKDAMYELDGIKGWLDRMKRSFVILVSPHPECIYDDKVRLPSPIEELREFYTKFEQELQKNDIKYLKLTQLDRQERVNTVVDELNKFKQRKGRRPVKDDITQEVL